MARPRKPLRGFEASPGDLPVSGELRYGRRETAAERASRIRIAEADAAARRFRDKALLVALLAATGVALLIAVGILTLSGDPAMRNWATSTLTAIVTGYFAYHRGKQGD